MFMSLMLGVIAQQDLDRDVDRIMHLAESRALSEASQAWDDCLDASKERLEPSGEPADVVATAALFSCQSQYAAMFQASIAYSLASRPGAVESELRAALMERSEDHYRSRAWRLTHDVVVQRLGRRQ